MARASSAVSLPCSRSTSSTVARRVLQLAQIDQPLVELAQLRVVEAAGRLLAVAGDERHRRAFVQQLDGGGHLRRLYAELFGDARHDLQLGGHGVLLGRLRGGGSIAGAQE